MRTRSALASAVVGLLAVGSVHVAEAAKPKPKPKPKPFTKTFEFTDTTPDPTGNLAASEAEHCNGELPRETPIDIAIPGPGFVDVTLSGFQGDWTLQLQDASGELIGGADVNPPDYEAAGTSVKKKTTIKVLPCNLAGTPIATVKVVYTPK